MLFYAYYRFSQNEKKWQFRGFPDLHPELLKDIPTQNHPPVLPEAKKRVNIFVTDMSSY